MQLRRLEYFVAVAEESHFRRAAERLFVAQPSLSAQIAKLEHELGAKLFVRGRRGVSLTSAGEALLEPARRILADAAALPELAKSASRSHAQLTVGYVPYVRTRLLPPLLDGFRAAFPMVAVNVRVGNDSPEVFRDLREGRIDLGILRAPVAGPWLQQLQLTVEPFHAAVPVGHRLATLSQVRLADLEGETFALFPRELNPPAHDHLMGFFDLAGYRPNVGQASRRMDDSLVFVASGAGVGLFPASIADTNTSPDICFRPIIDPTPTVEILLCWDRYNLNQAVDDFVEMVRSRTVRTAS